MLYLSAVMYREFCSMMQKKKITKKIPENLNVCLFSPNPTF